MGWLLRMGNRQMICSDFVAYNCQFFSRDSWWAHKHQAWGSRNYTVECQKSGGKQKKGYALVLCQQNVLPPIFCLSSHLCGTQVHPAS